MLLAMAWSTQGDKFTSIFEAVNKIPLCFAPAISCVFLWGVFWPRGTRQGALAALVAGFVVGTADFALDLPLFPLFGENGELRYFTDVLGIPFMQQAWLFVFSSVVYFAVSLATPRHEPEEIANLCWKNPAKALFSGRIQGFSIRVSWR